MNAAGIAGLILSFAYSVLLGALQPINAWRAELDRHMAAKQYAEARVALDHLTNAILERSPAANATSFANLAILRGLIESRLGNADAAEWAWYAAATLSPVAVASRRPGTVIAQLAETAEKNDLRTKNDPRRLPQPNVQSPKNVSRTEPVYPIGMRKEGIEQTITVEFVLDETGRPRQPRLLGEDWHPYLGHAALDAVQHWRFEPAMKEGKPFPVLYYVTISFKLTK